MNDREYESIIKMIEYINKSLNYTNGYTYQDFCNDVKTQDATIFNISQIGELVKNISEKTIDKYNNIEWKMIKGLRNRIIHDYSGINLNNIWYVVNNDLKELKRNLEKILEDKYNSQN